MSNVTTLRILSHEISIAQKHLDQSWLWPKELDVLLFTLVNLAGLPPTLGFFTKFVAFNFIFWNGNIGLLCLALLISAVAVAYYLNFIAYLVKSK